MSGSRPGGRDDEEYMQYPSGSILVSDCIPEDEPRYFATCQT